MDKIDYDILKLLQRNSRQKASSISESVHLSVSAVIERIRKMEREGIIQAFTIKLDYKKLGYDMSAYIGVTLEHPNNYDEFINKISNMESVISCNYVTGEFDFLLVIMTTSTEGLEKVHREIKMIKGVMGIKTFFVLSNIKDDNKKLFINPMQNYVDGK